MGFGSIQHVGHIKGNVSWLWGLLTDIGFKQESINY